jgi:hypothetical protein
LEHLFDTAEKPVAAAVYGLDEFGMLRVVAKREAKIVDVLLDEPLRHTDVAPDGVENLILRQQAVRIVDEQSEQLKGLVADTDGLIAVPKALIP